MWPWIGRPFWLAVLPWTLQFFSFQRDQRIELEVASPCFSESNLNSSGCIFSGLRKRPIQMYIKSPQQHYPQKVQKEKGYKEIWDNGKGFTQFLRRMGLGPDKKSPSLLICPLSAHWSLAHHGWSRASFVQRNLTPSWTPFLPTGPGAAFFLSCSC